MATHSIIAMQVSIDKYIASYCCYDGYIGHNGFILENFYDTKEKVQELLELGDLNSLGKTANRYFAMPSKLNIYYPCFDNKSNPDKIPSNLTGKVLTYSELIDIYKNSDCKHLYVYRDDGIEGQWYLKYKDNKEILVKDGLIELIQPKNGFIYFSKDFKVSKTSILIFKYLKEGIGKK